MSRQTSVNKHLTSRAIPRDYDLAKKLTEAVEMFRYAKSRERQTKAISPRWWEICEELWRLVK